MTGDDYLSVEQRGRRDRLTARRDAVRARDPRVEEDDQEFLPTMLAIMEDPAQSPDDLLNAIETHVRGLEAKYPLVDGS